MKKRNLAIISAFSIILCAGAAMTALGWGMRIRFYFGLLPFEESKSASVEAFDLEERYIVRPVSDLHQLRFMNLITSATKAEGEVILDGWHPGVFPSVNRTVPRFHMGWVDPTRITVFGTEYDVCYLEMWVIDEALYLNVRHQGEEDVVGTLFLIEDPELATKARDLMMEAF